MSGVRTLLERMPSLRLSRLASPAFGRPALCPAPRLRLIPRLPVGHTSLGSPARPSSRFRTFATKAGVAPLAGSRGPASGRGGVEPPPAPIASSRVQVLAVLLRLVQCGFQLGQQV